MLVVQACDDGYTCPLSIDPALRVAVVDSITQEPSVMMPTVTIGTSTGASVELGASSREPGVFLAYGASGVYSVVVRADGYAQFAKGGIAVPASTGKCGGVNTARLTAKMQKAM